MKKLFIPLFISYMSAFAVVPTIDVNQEAQDTTTTLSYAAQIPGYLNQMNSAMNAAQQVSALKGLQQVSGAGQTLCQLCDAKQLNTMQNYVDQVNGDLCSQFSYAMSNITGSNKAITSLQGVMAAFATNPKAAALALQQASVATQSATQNTLAQIQMLEAQKSQKQLAEDRYAKAAQSSMQGSVAGSKW